MFAPLNSSPGLAMNIEDVAAYQIKLKKVLGLTVCSNAALDVSPTNGVLAYPAGCTVVLLNWRKSTQSYLLNTSRKAITAIAYSQCGRYVATGECGQNPAIKVWELDASATSTQSPPAAAAAGAQSNGTGGSSSAGTVVAEFLGHKYAVSCIAFSPTGKYLVSVGSQHDMIVNVFDWKLNLKMASNKVSAKVVAVCFSQDGNYFVTVGNRHVKYWYLEGSRKYKEPIPLMGRSAILGELRNNDFCAVACGKGEMADSTYAITRAGHLVEFNSRRLLDKWVLCRTASANCLAISSQYIFVGCSESLVRVFNAVTLEYLTTLPRTHRLGADVSLAQHMDHITQVPTNSRFPDTIAMVFDEPRQRVCCIYNDHSLYLWDLHNIRHIGKTCSFLYHSACIWGVESVPYNVTAAPVDGQTPATVPMDCFITCSSDDTIRFWSLDEPGNEPQPPASAVYRKNMYSQDLLKVVYIDDEMLFIKDTDNPIVNMEKPSTYDGRNGVRCIKISPDRQHLASGDRSGNIRIFSLATLRLITTIEAHDSEVLCLEYTNDRIDRRLLASASRDRLIHVFDVDDGYRILQTLDDHSSSITSVKFIGAGDTFQMVSCGADKSIIFRTFQGAQFQRGHNCAGKTTLYDMEIDSNAKHILTACQDRNIRIYGTQNAKHTKTFKGSHSDDGSLIKLSLDLSGIYVATSCTDKTLSVYDYYSTECMARMYGHSELVTGLKFTNDCRHLISASGDGCIFIWQVPHDMVVTMQARLSQQAMRSGQSMPATGGGPAVSLVRPMPKAEPGSPLTSPPVKHEHFGSPPPQFLNESLPVATGYKFSDVGQLPQWAQKNRDGEPPAAGGPQPAGAESPPASAVPVLGSSPSQQSPALFGQTAKPRGRWAQKATFEPDALDALRTGSTVAAGGSPAFGAGAAAAGGQTSDYSSASSKDVYQMGGHAHSSAYLSEDSSIDSGVENRRELLFNAKNDKRTESGPLQFESNNEHDGDVEDISDGERTGSEHGLFYPASGGPGTPTDFKVNAMNEDELRKSVRRQKFERQGLQLNVQPHSGSPGSGGVLSSSGGTGTSDEDEGSTPSGDNADRSLASTLGGSSDSIPAALAANANATAASNSFLQAAIDGPGSLSDRGDRSRRSISAKHNSDGKSFSKSFSNTKKDELMKVINEAKQKLENVGYRSTLRSSQSISDLSHAANLERTGRGQRNSGNPKSLLSHHHRNNTYNSSNSNLLDDDSSSSMRRACSLSDLSLAGKAGSKSSASLAYQHGSLYHNNSNSPKPTATVAASVVQSPKQPAARNAPKRSGSTVGQPKANATIGSNGANHSLAGMGTRSISVGTLNQPLSDSDAEAIVIRPVALSRSHLANSGAQSNAAQSSARQSYALNGSGSSAKSASGIINRRRGLSNAYSSVNLSSAGPADDSSSEEAHSMATASAASVTSTPPNGAHKPAVPPRPRSISATRNASAAASLAAGASGSPTPVRPVRRTVETTANSTVGSDSADLFKSGVLHHLDNADLTSQLCSNVISQLMLSTSSVLQLHQRLKHHQTDAGPMLLELEQAVAMTQSMLHKVTGAASDSGNHVTFSDTVRSNGGKNDAYHKLSNYGSNNNN